MTIDIVPTKVIIPKRTSGVVRRPRLLDFLHENLERKLLLVTAPAGYGKTTLVVDFANEVDLSVCWYTLDEGDRDPSTFMAYLVASVRQKFPNFGERSMSMSESGMLVARSAAAALATDMVNDVPEYFVLVLDDWHLVGEDATIRELLDHLLNYLPEHAHIIVAGRTLPRGPLIRLTAQGAVAGLGPAGLRFTPEEARQLLASKYDLEVSEEQATKLVEESEGWITGILLTSQAMWQGLLASLIHAGGAPGALYEYLAGEVFDRLSPPLRRFLLESAVPRQFTAQLCDDLRAVSASEVWIEQVESRNLYLTRVETEEGTWFRYHHLFREFLIARFKRDDPAGLARLRLRAAELFESRHRPEEAVEHYLAAGAPDRAARVMDAAARSLFIAGRAQTLQNWFERLPANLRLSAPELGLFQGQALVDRGQTNDALPVLEQAEAAFRARGDVVGQIRATLPQGWVYYARGKSRESLALGQNVLQKLAEAGLDIPSLRAQALRLIGSSHTSLGQWHEGEDYLAQALALYRQSDSSERQDFNLGRVLQDLANALRSQGRLEEAAAHQLESLAIWRRIGTPGPLAASLNNAAYDRFLVGDYDGALQLYSEALEKAEEASDQRTQAYMLDGIAATHRDRGNFQKAIEIYKEVFEMANGVGDQWLASWALDGLGHAYRLANNLDRAMSLFEQARRFAEREGNKPQVVLSLASGGIAKVEQRLMPAGIAELEQARDDLRAAESHLDLARILFWLGRAYYEAGQHSLAKTSIMEMIRLGNRFGLRPFSLAEGRRAFEFVTWAAGQIDANGRLQTWIESLHVKETEPRLHGALQVISPPRIEVYAFGPGQVYRDGRMLTPSEWHGSAIARELLFYLLEHSPQRKEEIGANLWPELPLPRMTNTFHATKYRIRHALNVEFVLFEGDTYRVDPTADIRYDVTDFKRLLGAARSRAADDAGMMTDLQGAIDLYKGDYLTSVYSDWVMEPRQALQTQYLDALSKLLEVLLRHREYEHAIALCLRGLETDYYHEDFHRGLMWSLAESGRRAEALAHYQDFARRLRKELRASPAQETKDLAARIRSRR